MTARRLTLALALLALGGGAAAAQPEPAPLPPAPPPAAEPAPTPDPAALPAEGGEAELDKLAALVGQDESEEEARQVRFFGFADFLYYRPLGDKDNPWLQYFHPYGSFMLGNLNLYMAADLSPRARSMAEVRFMFAPNGVTKIEENGQVTRTNTDSLDFPEWGRVVRWGGIQIERAWVEYDLAASLTLRAGYFLTPYGIWNVDHGSPSIVGIRRPWTVREQLFPERQAGLELHGRRPFGALSLGYHLTLSNGRGPTDSHLDTDESKALGGRLLGEWRGDSVLTLGLSFYRGQTSDESRQWLPTADPLVAKVERILVSRYQETSLAADLRFQGRRLLLQSEFIYNERVYGKNPRPLAPDWKNRLAPDLRRFGAYGLAGYRTPFFALMPYLLVELYEMDSGTYPSTAGHLPRALSFFYGVNFRPEANLVLKIEGWWTTFPGATGWGEHDLRGLQVQAAWVF